MRHPALRVATWLFSWLVPKDMREPLMGDLAEEYARRENATSSSAAFKWYLQQMCASALPLLWVRLTRAVWISTLGVAVLAYLAAGFVDFAVKRAIPNWTADGTFAPSPLGLIITFAAVMLIGYFAEWLRRRAATVMGAMMLLAVTAMTVTSGESWPLWFRVAWFFVGPAASVGGMLCSLRRARA